MKAMIPFAGPSYDGESYEVNYQRSINCFTEVVQTPGLDPVYVIFGYPGKRLFVKAGIGPIRGIHEGYDDALYAVSGVDFYRITRVGSIAVPTKIGELDTDVGKVVFADSGNNNGTEIMLVDGTYGYVYNYGTQTITKIADPDFPGQSSHCCFFSGYFVANTTEGRFVRSAAYNGTQWDALDFATAEQSPDELRGIIADHNSLVLTGKDSTEFWIDDGSKFFKPNKSRFVEYGSAASHSLAKGHGSTFFLARNRQGQSMVMRVDGKGATKISDYGLEQKIQSYSTISDAEGFCYQIGGHPFYHLNFPQADKTHLYDASTNQWHELQRYNEDVTKRGRDRASCYATFKNLPLVGDYESGNIYELSMGVYTENGSPLIMEKVSAELHKDRRRIFIPRFELDMETGVGLEDVTAQGGDPEVVLYVSHDRGRTWNGGKHRKIGKTGERNRNVLWHLLGSDRSWNFKIVISDPIKRVIRSAIADISVSPQ